MKRILSLTALAIGTLTMAFALSSCGGSSFSCNPSSKCSADPPQTDADKNMCTAALAGKCADQYKAYGQCFIDNQKCDMNNKTDGLGTLALCQSQFQAYQNCAMSSSM